MRLVVISDTHGRSSLIDRVLQKETGAGEVFFLGDTVGDIEDVMPFYPDKSFHIVRGNCDYFSRYPLFGTVSYAGTTVYFTHGHGHSVKSGTDGIFDAAKNIGADIVLYGHTHIPSVEYKDGLYLVNCGSLALPKSGKPSYAVIDITQSGVLPTIKCI